MSWLEGWSYRKKIDIASSADGALANYQQGVTLVRGSAAPWTNGRIIQPGQYVRSTMDNGYVYRASVGGTSGGSEPTWGTTVGGTTTDNTVTWVCVSNVVFIGTRCKGDFSDIRFMDASDNLLSHQVVKQVPFLRFELNKSASFVEQLENGTLVIGAGDSIYLSVDSGSTISAAKLTVSGAVGWRRIWQAANGYIYASPIGTFDGTTAGLYRSVDEGQTFSRVLALTTDSVWGIDETSTGIIYAGVYGTEGCRIFKSTDNTGANFSSVYYDASLTHVHNVAVDRSNNYIYALFGDIGAVAQTYRSTDGTTFTAILGMDLPQCVGILCANGYRLFGTDRQYKGKIYKTTNDKAVTEVLSQEYGNCFFIRQNPITRNIYAGFIPDTSRQHAYRLYKSTDNGATWRVVSAGRTTSDLYGFYGASRFVNNRLYIYVRTGTGTGYMAHLDDVDNRADYYVKLRSVPASGGTSMYVYFGNATASAADNGDDTFLFWDGFDGAAFDGSKWDNLTSSSDMSVATGNSNLNISVTANSSTSEYYKGKSLLPAPMILGFSRSNSRAAGAGVGVQGPSNIVGLRSSDGTQHARLVIDSANAYDEETYTSASDGTSNTAIISGLTNNSFELSVSPGHAKYYVDGVVIEDKTSHIPTADMAVNIGGSTGTSGTLEVSLEYVYVRQFTANPPEFGASYAAESYQDIAMFEHRTFKRGVVTLKDT